jgi:hypothetical protein
MKRDQRAVLLRPKQHSNKLVQLWRTYMGTMRRHHPRPVTPWVNASGCAHPVLSGATLQATDNSAGPPPPANQRPFFHVTEDEVRQALSTTRAVRDHVQCYACFWYVSDCLISSCGFTIRIGIAGYHSGTPVLYCSVAFTSSDGGLSMDWTELCAKLLTCLFVCTIPLVVGSTSSATPSASFVGI